MSALVSIGLLAGAQDSFGQTVALGAAGSFALFTAIGNFGSTGTTAVTGDIGTNAGTLTGFPPGVLTGTSHVVDLISEDAAKDVDGAYAYLADFASGNVLTTPLGSGQVLTAGTYRIGAATALAGNMNLDGEGNPNAVFIIKIDGPLSVAAASNVRLINSTAWENVYWVVNGQVDIGANAAFKGIILGNGGINLLTNATLQGRGLTRAGAITLTNNIVTTSSVATPLPVQLTSFTAERRDDNALLRWTTASELNNAYFAVQSSTDGSRYSTIGKVRGHGSTSMAQAYTWADARLNHSPAAVIYYRLAQVDADSSRHYSPVRTLATAPVAGLGLRVQAYPSPSQSPCSLRIDGAQEGPVTLRLTDALGHKVAEHQLLLVAGSNSLPLAEANGLLPGIYLVQVQQGAVRRTIRLVRE
ncbi:hypothetical protein GCM10028824_26270 [Hymenobacter segetis]|uniref:Ice-binding family protein n=1 Tax=Hymenobacter segetis TaxID=2025509 RepID=A0ABU9M168_9BACT